MLTVGIDPGAIGQLCALDPASSEMEFFPTPNKQKLVLPVDVLNWLQSLEDKMGSPVRIIGIEDVHAIHKTSAGSTYNFGYNTGAINAIAACSGIGLDQVKPKEWQKDIGIPQTRPLLKGIALKRAIAAQARLLYPKASLLGPGGGPIDGRADSLMIAHYFAIKYGIFTA